MFADRRNKTRDGHLMRVAESEISNAGIGRRRSL
jgi:hypothetical protein